MTSQRRKRIKFWRWARRNELMVGRELIEYRTLWARTKYNEPSRYRIRFLPKGWKQIMLHDAYIYKGKP